MEKNLRGHRANCYYPHLRHGNKLKPRDDHLLKITGLQCGDRIWFLIQFYHSKTYVLYRGYEVN